MTWFDIDKAGLAKLLERRGKEWILAELLQNAWDAPGTTTVNLNLHPVPGKPLVDIEIIDDSPEGFTDIAHAFTLFGESVKKGDPTLRGRFNLGEKLVLALCQDAKIITTKGTVEFHENGTRTESRARLPAGTRFSGRMRMTRDELESVLLAVEDFLPPKGIRTFVNNKELLHREPLHIVEAVLPTEIANSEGVLIRSRRKTVIAVHQPLEGKPGRIYEMGIPIVETGDTFDIDIGQKVPVSMERDSVSPSYLRDARVAVLNATASSLKDDATRSPWVEDALDDENASDEAVKAIVLARFGNKVVSYDPSDAEANARATSLGYKVVHGGSFSRQAWEHIRRSQAMLPAGRVTPTPKPFDPEGNPAEHVEKTEGMHGFLTFCRALAREIMGVDIAVHFLKTFNARAAYGNRTLSFNVSSLGEKWFNTIGQEQIDLVIHEFGHEYASDHLSDRYYRALTRLAGQSVMLAIENPALFNMDTYLESEPGMKL